MKKIFTLALLVIAYTVSAHPNDGKMSVTNLSSQRIVVELDGKKFEERNDVNDKFFLMPDLPAGFHTVKVYVLEIGRSAVRMGMRKQTLIFQKNVNVRPQYHVDIVVNRFGKVWYDELSMRDPKYIDADGGDWNNNRDDDYRPGQPSRPDRDPNPGNGNYPGNGTPGNGNYPGNGTPGNGNYPGNGYIRPMNDQSFAALKETLSKERFDNSRVTIAKQVIDQNYFTAEQVKQLAQMYSFDNYKLDIAKYAYKNTLNKQDYFILYEVFQFSNSKEDLANYIRQFK